MRSTAADLGQSNRGWLLFWILLVTGVASLNAVNGQSAAARLKTLVRYAARPSGTPVVIGGRLFTFDSSGAGIRPASVEEAGFGFAPVPNCAESDARMLDTTVLPVPVPGQMFSADVAFDGSNWLVVWEHHVGRSDIYCARIDSAGTVLDRFGIPAVVAPGYQVFPQLAFNGHHYLIVWEDWRGGSYADIYAARVTPGGVVLDPGGFPVCTAPNDQWHPAVVWSGSNWLIVWEDFRDGEQFDIRGVRLDTAGTVLAPGEFALAAADVPETGPVVAAAGDTALVCWTLWPEILAEGGIYGRRIDGQGTILDPEPLLISDRDSLEYAPAIAAGPDGWLVTWIDTRRGEDDVFGARVSPGGAVIDPNGIAVSTAAGAQRPWSVAFDGTNYIATWEDRRNGAADVYCARVNQSGTVLDPNGIAVCAATDNQVGPAVAAGSTATLVVWDDDRDPEHTRSYFARFDQTGTVLEPNGRQVALAANSQSEPAVAFDGTGFLVVWADAGAGGSDIRAIKVDQTGRQLAAGFTVSAAPRDQLRPAVAFDGDNFLVVWEDWRGTDAPDVYGARVSRSGAVLDPAGIAILAGPGRQTAPAVAFGGGRYVVAVQNDRFLTGWDDIYGVRLNPDGTVLDSVGFPIDTASHWQVQPRLDFSGSNFLVVWEDHRAGLAGDIYACRLGLDGLPLDPVAEGFAVTGSQRAESKPDLAYDGANWLVAWECEGFDRATDIRYCRVRREGGLLDPTGRTASAAPDSQSCPRVVFDGNNWLVLWRNRSSADAPRLGGVRINSTGGIAGYLRPGINAPAAAAPAACRGGLGAFAVWSAWTWNWENRAYNSWRVWGEYLAASSPAVGPGWFRCGDVSGSLKRVKHGGSLVALGDKVYALVGNNTRDLLAYDIDDNHWTTLTPVPTAAAGPARNVNRGACAASDGNALYIIKGNNTSEFWCYEPNSGRWEELPQPEFSGRIKAGSMAFDGSRSIYLVPGNNRNEWRVFDLRYRRWMMPRPETLPGLKWKKGSLLVCAGGRLYGVRGGSKTNEFYSLDLSLPEPVWQRRTDLPLVGREGRRRKVKDGAAAAWGGDRLWLLKGGNSLEFFAYDPELDEWRQYEDVGQPSGVPAKKVKAGGALAYSTTTGGLYALVGNNTNEFWGYLPGADNSGVMGTVRPLPRQDSVGPAVFPSLVRGSGPVQVPETTGSLRIYDSSGRLVMNITGKAGGWRPDVSGLAPGIYFLQTDGRSSRGRMTVVR